MLRVFLANILVFLLANSAFAGGMAVADAISHMYESLGLEKTVQQLETALQQLELVQKYTNTIEQTYNKAHSNYKKAQEVYDNIMAIKDFYNDTKTTLMGKYSDYAAIYEKYGRNGVETVNDLEDISNILELDFPDPRNMTAEEYVKVVDRQFDLQQLNLKDLITSNEELLSQSDDQVQKIESLAAQSDSTMSPKEAQDLTNRILLEILSLMQQALTMDARYQQTMATLNYRGVSPESVEARQKRLTEIEEWAKKERWETRELAKFGLSEDSTAAEIRSNSNKPTLKDIINF